jgi:DNA repair protein RadC
LRVREAEIVYRPTGISIDGRKPLRNPQAAVDLIRQLVISDNREVFSAFYLDSRRRVLAYQRVSVGTLSQSLVHPREVFQPAVLMGAASVVVMHNHPSGCSSASAEDHEVTKRLIEAGKILGIEVVDHIIWTRHDGFLSFRQEGHMP